MRMDLIWPGRQQSTLVSVLPQLYPTCAHIQVESEYSGSLPEGISIPEDLADDKPGMSCFFLTVGTLLDTTADMSACT